MAIAPPDQALTKEEADRLALQMRAEFTTAVVWDDGRVTEHYVPPTDELALYKQRKIPADGPRRGHTPVRWINGRFQIDAAYVARCQLLEDVCKQDGCPERYKQWRAAKYAVIVKRQPIRGTGPNGKVTAEDMAQLYPPSVIRLRQVHAAGGVGSGKAFVIGEGETDDPALNRDKVADLMKGAGLGDPRSAKDPPKATPKATQAKKTSSAGSSKGDDDAKA
jgi:hypothetical protein